MLSRKADKLNAMPGPRVSALLEDFETTNSILHLELTAFRMFNGLQREHSIGKLFLLDIAEANLLVAELQENLPVTLHRGSRADYGLLPFDEKLQLCNDSFKGYAQFCKDMYEQDHATLLELTDAFKNYYKLLMYMMQDNTACFARTMAQDCCSKPFTPDINFANMSEEQMEAIADYGMPPKALHKMMLKQEHSKGRQMCALDKCAMPPGAAERPVEVLYKSANREYLRSMCEAIFKQAAEMRHDVWKMIKCTHKLIPEDASKMLLLIQRALAEIAAHLTECLPGFYLRESPSDSAEASTGAADSDEEMSSAAV